MRRAVFDAPALRRVFTNIAVQYVLRSKETALLAKVNGHNRVAAKRHCKSVPKRSAL